MKPNLDITGNVVEIIKNRKISEWKNADFLQFVKKLKDEYNLPVKKITEFMKNKFGIISQ